MRPDAALKRPASRAQALGLFERALVAVAPTWAARRAVARVTLMQARLAQRQYEAAGVSRRTEGWGRGGTSSPNSVLRTGLDRLRERSRQMIENVGWASTAISELENEVVGTGIRAQIREQAGLSERKARRLQDVWTRWAENPLECDAEGKHDIYGLQALAMRCIGQGGEVLGRRRWRSTQDGLTVPFQIQVLEADHLDTTREQLGRPGAEGAVIQGIEYTGLGAPSRYWLYPNHPGDTYRATIQSSPVRAADIVHPFRTLRPGQARGVPWGAPCLLALRDFADYTDATRLRAKIANAFTGFVHDLSVDLDEPIVGSKPSSMENTLEADQREFEPGSWEVLPEGKTITFSNPPSPDRFEEVSRVNLLEIAAGFEIPYERLTGDYKGMPFSASRMSEMRFMRRIDGWRWRMFIPQFCQATFRWFLQAAELAGEYDGPPNLVPIWTPQRREMIEPGKETEAMKKRVRCGFSSMSEELRGLGYDPRTVFEEVAEERALIDQLGLVFDSDPRQDQHGMTPDADAEPVASASAADENDGAPGGSGA